MADHSEKIKKLIAENLNCDIEKVKPEASFINDLGADSLETVELIMSFEDEFKIEIKEEDSEKIKTVGDAIAYINKHAK